MTISPVSMLDLIDPNIPALLLVDSPSKMELSEYLELESLAFKSKFCLLGPSGPQFYHLLNG